MKTSHCEKMGKGSKEGLGNGEKRFHYCFSVKEGILIKRGHYAKGKRGVKMLEIWKACINDVKGKGVKWKKVQKK